MSEDALLVSDLHAGYDGALVLRGVSLEARPGEIVAVIGPNGAGKSTLLKAISGLVRPIRGRVVFHGTDVTGLPPDRLAQRGLGFVPQLENVFPSLTVAENVHVGAQALPRSARRKAVASVFAQFPFLRERGRQRAGTLSGGQRKIVALARALVAQPTVLLLDEPSAGLSPKAAEMVFAELEQIRERGIGIVMVEQNARRALALSSRGYVLDMGRTAHEGPGGELLRDPRVVQLYLGGLAADLSPRRPDSSARRDPRSRS
ncbi:MAG: ABC transporter ATP-binding protein [Gaiellaceae bacterium]|nr:MAG: ABC transporter ATP-binding protein [Gaiellaceae bacterium]